MPNTSCDFRYIRSLTGELSGPSMISQTEQALNDICETSQTALTHSEQAVDTSNLAETISRKAEDVANHALQIAQAASGEAGNVAEQLVQVKRTADTAYATANTAKAAADAAKTTADHAQQTADSAIATAKTADGKADQAVITAGGAANEATLALTTANSLRGQIQNLATSIEQSGVFTVDPSQNVNLDAIGDAVRRYFTGSISTPLPTGIAVPFWFLSWKRSDGLLRQMIYKDDGFYARDSGTGRTVTPGAQTLAVAFGGTAISTLTLTAAATASLAMTASAGQLQPSYSTATETSNVLTATFTASGNGNVTAGGKTIATITNGVIKLAADPTATTDKATFTFVAASYVPGILTLVVTAVWTARVNPTWGRWWHIGGGRVDTGNTVALTADMSGKGTFDADGNVSIAATIPAKFTRQGDTVALTGDVTGTGTVDAQGSVSVTATTAAGVVKTGKTVTLTGGVTGTGTVAANGNTSIAATVTSYKGATEAVAGTAGAVPPAAAGDQAKVLTGGGTWVTMPTEGTPPDGTTIEKTAAGVLTVKDVAIGGYLSDLASARGQIGNGIFQQGKDADAFIDTGVYPCDNQTTNVPVIAGQGAGWLEVFKRGNLTSYLQRYFQLATGRIFCRRNPDGQTWMGWYEYLTALSLGDGIKYTSGKISVPEYEGATASAPATSGLVPPAAAGDQSKVLTGAGTWATPAAGGVVDTGNTLTLTGKVTGTAAFDASGNVSVATAVGDLSGTYQAMSGKIPATFSALNGFSAFTGASLSLRDTQANFILWNAAANATISQGTLWAQASKLVTILIKNTASAAITVTWPSAFKWVGMTDAAPTWGSAGATLLVNVWLFNTTSATATPDIALASVVYNSEG